MKNKFGIILSMLLFVFLSNTPVYAQETPDMIVSSIKGIPYIGDQSYSLSAYYDEDSHPCITKTDATGILCAFFMDLDGDGEEEIFSVSYEPSELVIDGNSIRFSIFRQQDQKWEILAETEITGQDIDENYTDVSCMNGSPLYYEGSVFMRKYNGSYEFFYEDYGAGIFATGQTWMLRGYRFENGTLHVIPETENISYLGSPIDSLWEKSFDLSTNLTGEGELSMMRNYCSLGFSYPWIDFGQLTMDLQEFLYPVIRMKMDSETSVDYIMEWTRSHEQPLNTFLYTISDCTPDLPRQIEEFPAGQNSYTWDTFLASGDYKDDMILDFDESFLEYSIADVNSDGIPELFLQETSGEPFYKTWGFVMDHHVPVLVCETCTYHSLRYSASYNTVIAGFAPFSGCEFSRFCRLQGTKLDEVFTITEDEYGWMYNDTKSDISISSEEAEAYFNDASDFSWSPVPAATDSTNAAESQSSSDAYIIADSNTRYLDEAEAAALNTSEVQLAINEIFARHGRIFSTEEFDQYFRSKSWYQPDSDKTDAQIMAEFNEYEAFNVDLLTKYR